MQERRAFRSLTESFRLTHIASSEFAPNQALFAVFDGHGGREVAHYAKKHFEDFLKGESSYKSGNMV